MIYYENEDLMIWAGYKFGGWRVLILNAEDGTIRSNHPAEDRRTAILMAQALTAKAECEDWPDRQYGVVLMA